MHPLTTRYLKSSTRVVFNFSHIYVQQYWRYRFLVSVATKDRRVTCPCDVISNILYMARSVFLCFWAYEIDFWAASVIWIENQKLDVQIGQNSSSPKCILLIIQHSYTASSSLKAARSRSERLIFRRVSVPASVPTYCFCAEQDAWLGSFHTSREQNEAPVGSLSKHLFFFFFFFYSVRSKRVALLSNSSERLWCALINKNLIWIV